MNRFSLLAAAAALMLTIAGPASAQRYTVTDLGSLRTDNDGSSLALGINNLGQVVGLADTNQGTRRAFMWSAGLGIVDLATMNVTLGGSHSAAYALNDTGTIVGEANIPGTINDPFEYSHAFYHSTGTGMQDLNGRSTFLGGQNSRTTAVNASGRSCGLAQDQLGRWRAFRYDPSGGLVDLGTLGGLQSRANGINDQNEIAGTSDLPDGSQRAALWSPSRGTFTFFFRGSKVSEAFDVNNAGLVVGSGLSGRQTRAFTADTVAMKFQALNGRSGAKVTVAKALNNGGRIVGWSGGQAAQQQRAVMWVNRRLVDLNSRLPRGSGWVLWRATDINEEGQIVGEGRFNGRSRAFLLTPQ